MLMQSGLEQLGGNFNNVNRVGLPANIHIYNDCMYCINHSWLTQMDQLLSYQVMEEH